MPSCLLSPPRLPGTVSWPQLPYPLASRPCLASSSLGAGTERVEVRHSCPAAARVALVAANLRLCLRQVQASHLLLIRGLRSSGHRLRWGPLERGGAWSTSSGSTPGPGLKTSVWCLVGGVICNVKPKGVREHAHGYTRQGGGVPGRVHSIPKPGSAPRQPPCLRILSSSHNPPESGGMGLCWSVQGTLRDEPQNTNCVISVIPHMHQML